MDRIKIFIDTNIILAGTFFSGIESILLNLIGVDIITADICLEEAVKVAKRIFIKLNITEQTVLDKLTKSFESFEIVEENVYKNRIVETRKLVKTPGDQKVLAAALALKPDYFVTGDNDFHKKNIKEKIKVVKTRDVLEDLGVI